MLNKSKAASGLLFVIWGAALTLLFIIFAFNWR
jgi:hypothetical protein